MAAGEESGCKDVPPIEPPLPVTGSAQHLSAQLWDTNTYPRGPQSLFEQGTCFKCKCFWDWEAWERWSSLGGRVKLYGERQDVVQDSHSSLKTASLTLDVCLLSGLFLRPGTCPRPPQAAGV